jgi:hypothetical protein
MTHQAIIDWLLEGDFSIQYQCRRDLLEDNNLALQRKIEQGAWAAALLSKRNPDGSWGRGFYQPKWISSHYTLLDLRNLCISPDNQVVLSSIEKIALENKSDDGGINPAKTIAESDACINGMFLSYACYFGLSQKYMESVVDFIISQQLPDGGFNCMLNRSGAVHSSLHTTLSMAEGIREYLLHDYSYRRQELKKIVEACQEFILLHQLYISDRTGEIIKKDFLRLPYPSRWKYDILRALDYFQSAQRDSFGATHSFDRRMAPAIDQLLKKRTKDGRWKLSSHHPGQRHIEMEQVGKPSRWNTLRALRVLKHFNIDTKV